MAILVNPDSPEQARAAREANISDIALCRTEALLLAQGLSDFIFSLTDASEDGPRQDEPAGLLTQHQSDNRVDCSEDENEYPFWPKNHY